MAVDAETLRDVSIREGFLYIFHATGQSAALVSSEGDNSLALQVVRMLLEDLRIPVNRGSGVSQRGKYPWLKPAP